MSIYASTNCIPALLKETLSTYTQLGIKNIELSPCAYEDGIMGAILQTKASCSLSFLIHNYFPPSPQNLVINLASQDKNILERSIQFCKASIFLCSKLGSPIYSVHGGFLTDPVMEGGGLNFMDSMKDKKPADRKQAHKTFLNSINQIISHVKQLGVEVEIVVENNVAEAGMEDYLMFLTADEFTKLPCRALLDLGHLNITSKTLGFDRQEFISQLSDSRKVALFHVHDNNGKTDSHLPLSKDSWCFDIITRPKFKKCPVSLESHFKTKEELASNLKLLNNRSHT